MERAGSVGESKVFGLIVQEVSLKEQANQSCNYCW
jgi:hypothetical protein